MGAVDERLIAEGRLRRLHTPREIELRQRERDDRPRVRRDPGLLADLLSIPVG